MDLGSTPIRIGIFQDVVTPHNLLLTINMSY